MKATYDDAMLTCNTLKSHGFDAFLAGGCVRDLLLGVAPSDYDITTSAVPEQVQIVFPNTVPVGISFGVVKVICGNDRELDVATFRTDGTYSDNRRPDTVQYSKSAEEDVKRRDFTINALLMDTDKKIIDYVGGQDDLKKRIIRTVGDPFARFAEDSLRMLRAIRFANKYNLDIDRDTWNSIMALASNIKIVSKERVTEELTKMLTGGKADKAFWSLHSSGLWESWFKKSMSDASRYWSIQHSLSLVEVNSDFAIPLAIILESMYSMDRLEFKDRLCLTNTCSKLSDNIIDESRKLTSFMESSLAKQRRMINHPNLELHKQFIRCKQYENKWAYDIPIDQSFSDVMNRMEEVKAMGLPDPIINGNDLIEWKYKPGSIFTSMIYSIQTEQLEGRITNKDQARRFLLNKFRAAPRTLADGTEYDGMSPARFVAQCSVGHVMSLEVACKPDGTIDWNTIENKQGVNVSSNDFYANCTFEYMAGSGWTQRCCGKRAKKKFVRAQV